MGTRHIAGFHFFAGRTSGATDRAESRRYQDRHRGEQCSLLEELLQVPDGGRTSRFDQLRKGPIAISGPAFNQAVARYLKLKAFGMQGLDFTGIPPVRFNALARYADMMSVYNTGQSAATGYLRRTERTLGRSTG